MSKIYFALIFTAVALVGGYVGMVMVERHGSGTVESSDDRGANSSSSVSLSVDSVAPSVGAGKANDPERELVSPSPAEFVTKTAAKTDANDADDTAKTDAALAMSESATRAEPLSKTSRTKRRSRHRRAKRSRISRRQKLPSDWGKKTQPGSQTTNVDGVIMVSDPDDNEPVKKPARNSSNRSQVGTTPIAEGFDE